MKQYLKNLERYLVRARKDIANNDHSKTFAKKIAWYSLKHCFTSTEDTFSNDKNKIAVLVELRGGVGDAILAIRYFYELKKRCGDVLSIDFSMSKNMNAKSLLYGHSFFDSILDEKDKKTKNYDVIVRLAVRYPEILSINEDKIKKLSPFFYTICQDFLNFEKENYLFFTNSPYNDLHAILHAKCLGLRRENQMDVSQKINLINSDFKLYYDLQADTVLSQFNLKTDQFITFQRGVGDTKAYDQNLTKIWSIKNYKTLVSLLKQHESFKDLKIVQLGSDLSISIDGVDLDLRGKTSFEELKALLVHAKYHIDGEAGMVHLRHFLCQKLSVVLFGPTEPEYYGYLENVNITCRPQTCPVGCEWLTPTWRDKCIISGTGEAICQKNITPEMVLERILKHIKHE